LLLISAAMNVVAQTDTRALALMMLLAWSGCSEDRAERRDASTPSVDAGAMDASTGLPDAGSADAGRLVDAKAERPNDAGLPPSDAGFGGHLDASDDGGADVSDDGGRVVSDAGPLDCTSHEQCELVETGCCRCEINPSADQLIAVPRDRARDAGTACTGGSCSCAPDLHDPLAPVLRAACVERRCVVKDVRREEASRCTSDSECRVETGSCCDLCTNEPDRYLALRSALDYVSTDRCDPRIGCPACVTPPPLPSAFCAVDGHCAVRRTETSGGALSTTCLSPTQALERASDGDVPGCDCTMPSVQNAVFCRADARGRLVALECTAEQRWRAVATSRCP
jgi:hypothetical protein